MLKLSMILMSEMRSEATATARDDLGGQHDSSDFPTLGEMVGDMDQGE
jgi:hypothetical protein